jgi:hypothetical protein
VPTARPRYPVTETDEVADVLDEAHRRWPDESRSRLIVRVLLDWHGGGRSPTDRRAARGALVGSLPGSAKLYDRDEWPD